MKVQRFRTAVIALVGAGALVLTGCGDDTDPGGATTNQATTQSTAEDVDDESDDAGQETDASTTPGMTSTTDDDATSTEPMMGPTSDDDDDDDTETSAVGAPSVTSDDDDDDDTPGPEADSEFCQLWNEADERFDDAEMDAQTFKEITAVMDDLEASAPPEIEEDVAYMGQIFEDLAGALERAGLEPDDLENPDGLTPQQQEAFMKEVMPLMEKMDSEEADRHGDAVTDYVDANC